MAGAMSFDAFRREFRPEGLEGEDLRNAQKLAFAGKRIFRRVTGNEYAFEELLYSGMVACHWKTIAHKTKSKAEAEFRRLAGTNAEGFDLAAPKLFGAGTSVYRLRHVYPLQGGGKPRWSLWSKAASVAKDWYKVRDLETLAEVREAMAAVAEDPLALEDFGSHRTDLETMEAAAADAIAVGDQVRYQVEGMPEERPAIVLQILETGWLVDDAGEQRVVPHTTGTIRKTGGAAPEAPAGKGEPSPDLTAKAVAADGAAGGRDRGSERCATPDADESGERRSLSPGVAGAEPQAAPLAPAAEGVAVVTATRCSSARALCACAGATPDAGPAQVLELPVLVRQNLALDVGPGIDQVSAAIRACLADERMGGLRAAALLSHVRLHRFGEKSQYKDWLAWGRAEFGLSERSLCSYLRAGMFLLSADAGSLPRERREKIVACTVPKIEQLARLDGRHLSPFLEKHDPSGMSRDELGKLVNQWLLTPEQTRQLESAQSKREREAKEAQTPAGRMARATAEILKLERVLHTAVPADPVATCRAGLILQQASLNAIEAGGRAKPKQMADLVTSLETLLEFARGLLAKSAE